MAVSFLEKLDERFQITEIYPRSQIDLANVRELLLCCVIDSDTKEPVIDEINEILEKIQESKRTNNGYWYCFIRDGEGGAIVGMAGVRTPEERIRKYIEEPKESIELVNLFLLPGNRGKGLGFKLMEFICKQAKEADFKHLVWSSGTRYQNTAWAFYDRFAGPAVCDAPDFFVKGKVAKVWDKKLV